MNDSIWKALTSWCNFACPPFLLFALLVLSWQNFWVSGCCRLFAHQSLPQEEDLALEDRILLLWFFLQLKLMKKCMWLNFKLDLKLHTYVSDTTNKAFLLFRFNFDQVWRKFDNFSLASWSHFMVLVFFKFNMFIVMQHASPEMLELAFLKFWIVFVSFLKFLKFYQFYLWKCIK